MVRAAHGLLVTGVVANTSNMNGKYSIASGSLQDVKFNDDYASKGHEFFDVYTPEIASHYGENFWTDMGKNAFPDHIVERFKGKVIAITGYEHDQVMVIPTGQPGVNPGKDVSVPMNWAYNHHYMMWGYGEHSEMIQVAAAPDDEMAHGAPTKWIAVEKPSAKLRKDTSIPTNTLFSEGNGGESRKSFHGYPNGFAQLIDSPAGWHFTPMQIDTRNRECGVNPEDVNNCTKFTPGPEPKQARYGRGIPANSPVSGVLECPCNENYGGDPIFYPEAKTKIVEHEYSVISAGTCSDAGSNVDKAQDCFDAVPSLGISASHFTNKSVTDEALPPACSVAKEKDGSATVYYNSAAGKGSCAGGTKRSGKTTSTANITFGLDIDSNGLWARRVKGSYCENNVKGMIQRFELNPQLPQDTAASDSLRRCENYCLTDQNCWGCSVDCGHDCGWNAITSCGREQRWAGSITGDISEKKVDGGFATISISGPADVWFGVGINATCMSDSPYSFIVNDTGVVERKIGTGGSEAEHDPGFALAPSIKLVSNVVSAGRRTVIFQRSLIGATSQHFTFDPSIRSMELITAVGKSQELAYHDHHGPAEISLVSQGTAACVCDLGTRGKLCETGGLKCNAFKKNCWSEAQGGDLLAQKNPTCNSAQYSGGLKCCGHKRFLLDVAQKEESLTQPLLRYHVKIRFWFQEYTADAGSGTPSHYNLDRIYYTTEQQAGEYDIAPAFAKPGLEIPGYPGWPLNTPTPGTTCTGTCPDGPDCDCEQTITFRWSMGNVRMLYAGGHCHAPACKSLNLYINNSGTLDLLCAQVPKYGKGTFPVDRFDEEGYVTLPPCLWSDDPSEGLQPSVWLPPNTQVVSIKKNVNTHAGHFGEMASWQMRGVHFQANSSVISV